MESRIACVQYGAIFEYFDSLLLGLTATPRSEVDRDTYLPFSSSSSPPANHPTQFTLDFGLIAEVISQIVAFPAREPIGTVRQV